MRPPGGRRPALPSRANRANRSFRTTSAAPTHRELEGSIAASTTEPRRQVRARRGVARARGVDDRRPREGLRARARRRCTTSAPRAPRVTTTSSAWRAKTVRARHDSSTPLSAHASSSLAKSVTSPDRWPRRNGRRRVVAAEPTEQTSTEVRRAEVARAAPSAAVAIVASARIEEGVARDVQVIEGHGQCVARRASSLSSAVRAAVGEHRALPVVVRRTRRPRPSSASTRSAAVAPTPAERRSVEEDLAGRVVAHGTHEDHVVTDRRRTRPRYWRRTPSAETNRRGGVAAWVRPVRGLARRRRA